MSPFLATPLADVTPAPVPWLWEPYLVRGALAVLDGDPGVGKTFVLLDLAARLSRGGPLPGGTTLDRPHTTLLLTTGEDPATTLRPRAEAAGADLGRVLFVGPARADLAGNPAAVADHFPALDELVHEHKADLLVIDPLAVFFPSVAAASTQPGVYRALAPLARLAQVRGCTVLLVRGLNKWSGARSLYRGLGSVGIAGAVRTGLLVARHPDDPDLRVLAHARARSGPQASSLGFRLRPDPQGRAAVEWVGPVDVTADELCGPPPVPAGRRPGERAAEWLRAELAGGPRPAADLLAAAAAVGIAERTLRRARNGLRVRVRQTWRDGGSEWTWSDPTADPADGLATEEPGPGVVTG